MYEISDYDKQEIKQDSWKIKTEQNDRLSKRCNEIIGISCDKILDDFAKAHNVSK